MIFNFSMNSYALMRTKRQEASMTALFSRKDKKSNVDQTDKPLEQYTFSARKPTYVNIHDMRCSFSHGFSSRSTRNAHSKYEMSLAVLSVMRIFLQLRIPWPAFRRFSSLARHGRRPIPLANDKLRLTMRPKDFGRRPVDSTIAVSTICPNVHGWHVDGCAQFSMRP